jgi:hypothetical protein
MQVGIIRPIATEAAMSRKVECVSGKSSNRALLVPDSIQPVEKPKVLSFKRQELALEKVIYNILLLYKALQKTFSTGCIGVGTRPAKSGPNYQQIEAAGGQKWAQFRFH